MHGCPAMQFQFHYGTIKRRKSPNLGKREAKFQFHYGTIKRCLLTLKKKKIKLFQFHYGTIKSLSKRAAMIYIFSVSIPLWYD